ncbi:MAG TPA: hypothetical protein VGQ57_21170 [Polyangiaceae bacterium]|jgi:hypothetical protein|nr:hypothetical protein [Polyangiaceae bacterium]
MKAASVALGLSIAVGAFAASCASSDDAATAKAESAECLSDAGALYQRKIAPLLATDRPQTCNQCHLSGIDMSLFVRDDMCETRACLLNLGLVDLKDPDQSKVLAWIQRAQPDSDLITEDVINQEYDAFKEFVEQIARCGGAACPGVRCPATGSDEGCGSSGEADSAFLVPPGTSCDLPTIETQFRDTVYVWRDRCSPCHFSSDTSNIAPHWINVANSCNAGSLETFHNVIDLGLVDTQDPTQSLLLLKPVDAAGSGITHGGGAKFSGPSDPSYQSFLSFFEYWIGCGAPLP